jgi:hypothetical protein
MNSSSTVKDLSKFGCSLLEKFNQIIVHITFIMKNLKTFSFHVNKEL